MDKIFLNAKQLLFADNLKLYYSISILISTYDDFNLLQNDIDKFQLTLVFITYYLVINIVKLLYSCSFRHYFNK